MANNRTITVKIEGLQDLQRRVLKLKDGVRKKVLGSAVAAGALVTLNEAKKIAPKRTGALADAIKQRRSRKFSKQDYEERHVGVFKVRGGKYANTKLNRRKGRVGKVYESEPPEFYWRFLEFGTVRADPKPFLKPALQNTKSAATERIKQRCLQKLAEVEKELGP